MVFSIVSSLPFLRVRTMAFLGSPDLLPVRVAGILDASSCARGAAGFCRPAEVSVVSRALALALSGPSRGWGGAGACSPRSFFLSSPSPAPSILCRLLPYPRLPAPRGAWGLLCLRWRLGARALSLGWRRRWPEGAK